MLEFGKFKRTHFEKYHANHKKYLFAIETENVLHQNKDNNRRLP